jgi:hypothetical protein
MLRDVMKPKRRSAATTPQVTSSATIRIGFSEDAKVVFDGFSPKVRHGLRNKLREFGVNPANAKPLVGALKGYHRVTYGRVRAIAASSVEALVSMTDGIILVHVLYVGLRKQGAKDDSYEVAAAAIRAGEPDAIEAMELILQSYLCGAAKELDEED